MRDILTGLALLLVLALAAALAVPHFVDWGAWRGEAQDRLRAATGLPATIKGSIRVQLLPNPQVSLENVALGHANGSELKAGRAEASLSATALLRGEFRFTRIAVRDGHAHLKLDTGGQPLGLSGSGSGGLAPDKIIIERLIAEAITVSAEWPGGGLPPVRGVSAEIEAQSLAGPYKGHVRIPSPAGSRTLRISGGRIENGQMRVKALIEHEAMALRLEADGTASLAAGPGEPLFQGVVQASGNFALQTTTGFEQIVWRMASPAKAGGSQLSLDAIELTLGAEPKAVRFSGTARLPFQGEPEFRASLTAKHVDLDALIAPRSGGARGAPVRPPSEIADFLAGRLNFAGLSGPAAAPPVPVRLLLAADTLIVGGDVISNARIEARAAGPVLHIARAEARLPGEAEAVFENPMPGGRGRLRLEARDAQRLAQWAGQPQVLHPSVRAVSAHAELALQPGGMAAENVDISAAGGHIRGRLEWQSAAAGTRPALSARLQAEGMPLDVLAQALAGQERGGPSNLDFDLSVSARNLRAAALEAGAASARILRRDGSLTIEEIDIRDAAGLSATGRSSLGAAGGALEARVTLHDPESAAALLDRLGSSEAAAALKSRAAILKGMQFTLSGSSKPAGGEMNHAVSLSGAREGFSIRAEAGWKAAHKAPMLAADTGFNASVAAEGESSAILELAGIPAAARAEGPGRLSLALNGRWSGAIAFEAALVAAGAAIKASGRLTPSQPLDMLAGDVSLASADLAPAAAALGIVFPPVPPGMSARLKAEAAIANLKLTLSNIEADFGGNPVRGVIAFNFLDNGRFAGKLAMDRLDLAGLISSAAGPGLGGPDFTRSARVFAPALKPSITGDIVLDAETLTFGPNLRLGKGGLIYRFDSSIVYVEHAEAETPYGAVKWNGSLRRERDQLSLSGKIEAEGLTLPGIAPKFEGSLTLAGAGRSAGQLIASLAGGGALTHPGLTIPLGHPRALSATLAEFRDASPPPEPGRLAAALTAAGAGAAHRLPAGTLPVNLTRGVLRAGPVAAETAEGRAAYWLAADLPGQSVEARAELQAHAAPKGWSGSAPRAAIIWSGGLERGAVTADVTQLASGLTAAALSRDLERVEMLEQDQRERVLFLRRRQEAEGRAKREREERLHAEMASLDRAELGRIRLRAGAWSGLARRAEEAALRAAADSLRLDEESRRAAEDKRRLDELFQDGEDKRRAENAVRQEEQRLRARDEALRRAREAAPVDLLPRRAPQPGGAPGIILPAPGLQ